jgi:FAD/FMN-containing dehydrogenase
VILTAQFNAHAHSGATIVAFSRSAKEITVEAGITWRKLQEYIDRYELSVQIMQSYANFTVGGALSVNAHGRYVGQGPVVLSVKSIRIVLPDGDLINADPNQNSEVFFGAIGGYGALGVIVEATLRLTDNVRVERQSVVMPLREYAEFFANKVRGDPGIVFHNADIYPGAFDTVRATSYVRTDKTLTVEDRLVPSEQNYREDRWAISAVSEWPGGKWIRRHIIDPLEYRGSCVEWRNYEASYDVRSLEPASRRVSTYVLQEYFVPLAQFDSFTAQMAKTLNHHHVNALNVSIRHASADPGTLLAWARSEVFTFVIYFKQGTPETDRSEVAKWTRELVGAAVTRGGAYYLPYQIVATAEQFRAAYPRASEFFALKQRLDPTYKFRNRLWDTYYEPPSLPTQ